MALIRRSLIKTSPVTTEFCSSIVTRVPFFIKIGSLIVHSSNWLRTLLVCYRSHKLQAVSHTTFSQGYRKLRVTTPCVLAVVIPAIQTPDPITHTRRLVRHQRTKEEGNYFMVKVSREIAAALLCLGLLLSAGLVRA